MNEGTKMKVESTGNASTNASSSYELHIKEEKDSSREINTEIIPEIVYIKMENVEDTSDIKKENIEEISDIKEKILSHKDGLTSNIANDYDSTEMLNIKKENIDSEDSMSIFSDTDQESLSNFNGEVQYHCDMCYNVFLTSALLEQHLQQGNCTSDLSVGIKKGHVRRNKGAQSKHQKSLSKKKSLPGCIHSGKKPYECDICKKILIEEEKPYECDICHKVFSDMTKLKSHKRIHTGGKLFECNICFKTFTYNTNLITHKRLHTGEKPYKCDICHKPFNTSSDLKRHGRRHTGEKPFKCNICCKAFADNSNLKSHKLTHIVVKSKIFHN